MSFFSDLFGGDSSVKNAARRAERFVDEVRPLDARDLELELDRMVLEGQLSPQQARAILVEQTAVSDIATDPRLRRTQMDALAGFEDIVDDEGMDARFRANMQRLQAEEDQALRGRIGAIAMDEQQRGVSGSGFGRVNRLLSAQATANRIAQRGMDEAAVADERYRDALQASGAMAGSIEDRDYRQQLDEAEARDRINQLNAAARQRTQDQNIASDMAAQEFNLTRGDRAQAFNLQQQAQEEARRAEIPEIVFDADLQRARARGDAALGVGSAQQAQNRERREGIGQAIGTGLAIASMFSDEDTKTDVEDIDIDTFLENVKGKQFKYKDGYDDTAYGVMADDVNSDYVNEVDGTKMVDYGKALPGAIASIADLHKRLKELENK